MNVTVATSQPLKNSEAAKNFLTVPKNGFAICPVRDILVRIGDKWSLLAILYLGSAEKMRFNELRKSIAGISQRMLTVTLRSLETDGFVTRTVYAEVPPRVEYHLTELGRSLLGAVVELGHWAKDHVPAVAFARQQAVANEGLCEATATIAC